MMVISRTPFRVSLVGGGSDLRAYYSRTRGAVMTMAINRYMYVTVNRRFDASIRVSYSKTEIVDRVGDLQHDLIREAMRRTKLTSGIEITTIADLPAGIGLGSSSSLAVGVLNALYAFKGEWRSADELARDACELEIETLGRPIGKQDQYIAAYGGVTSFDFHPDDSVDARRLGVSDDTLGDLEEHLLLFFTGYSRAASAMLADQDRRTVEADEKMLANLDHTKALGDEISEALLSGNTAAFGELMHEHWEAKRARTSGMSNADIDHHYETARAAGALGGKVVGAGAGGFLLVYAPEPNRVRRAMRAEGLGELRFRFDHLGCTVLTAG